MGIARINKKNPMDEERVIAAVREYGAAKQETDAAKRRLDKAKDELLNLAGEYGLDEIETDDGIVAIKEQAGRQMLDKKKLEDYFRDDPSILEGFYSQGKPHTRINWKAKLLTD